jgi:photosystem II stability/assembly factor-like uncharacterized protein
MKSSSHVVILSSLISCLGSAESLAQGGWFSQTVPPISDVYDVAYVGDAQSAVAVDSLGRVLRTSYGFRWDIQYTGETQLYGLSFLLSGTGTAVGELGTILRSTDRGVTWTPQDGGTTANLYSVSFVSRLTGTAVGNSGTILRTDDGGDTWTPQYADTLAPLYGVSFVSASNGIAVGDKGTILLTTDGGDTWNTQDSGTTRPLSRVLFWDVNTAFAVGDFGTLLRSTDGGDTWTQQADMPSSHLIGISFADANQGLAVGCLVSTEGDCESSGIILRTRDGGLTWNTESYGGSEVLYAVSFLSANTVIAVGQEEAFLFGPSWSRGSIPRLQLTSVSFLSATVGLAVGNGSPSPAIMRTTDGGMTWTVQPMVDVTSLHGVTIVDASRAFAVGFDGLGVILGTDDGGITWTRRIVGPTGTLVKVSFGDANTGVAVGIRNDFPLGGKIWRTTDGGYRWSDVYTGPAELYAVSMVSATVGTAVGQAGIILRTTDGGATWMQQFSGVNHALRGVSFVDEDRGIAVGGGRIFWTSNGGTWTYQSTWENQVNFLGVSLVDANTAFAVGERIDTVPGHGAIVRTTDGGATWTLQYSGIDLALTGVSMVDAITGTAVGGAAPYRGIILRTETGGE